MATFILATFLTALSFGGGCAITYFLMDAPRRRAAAQAARLNHYRLELDAHRERLDQWEARVAAGDRTLAAGLADLDRRTREHATAREAFDRRVIAYDELQAENRLLKGQLKDLVNQAAFHDARADDAAARLAVAVDQRDRLGRAYFDESAAAARKGLTPSNYLAAKSRVRAAADRAAAAGSPVPTAALDAALAELHEQFERALRAAAERDEQARLREQMRDEQRRDRDAAAAIEQAEREERAVAAALARAMADAADKLADATGRHAEEVERLKAELAEAEAKRQRAMSQAQLTKVGNVYVISNRGSFGPDVLKIGMTRRLTPQDRVDELGDASVPFPFDVHMMIACDDAPKLENALHRAFRRRRVNKVNLRKEFFRVSVEEVAEAVGRLHGRVEYTADAEALEYLQSQNMTDDDLAEVEQTFAAVGAGGDE